jgi:hypothetical protein
MTVFGKLLVFMNLVFSVVTGALIVFVFTTRANWQAAYEDAKNNAQTAEAAYKKEKTSHENDMKLKDSELASVVDERKALSGQVTDLQDKNQQLTKAAADQTNLNKSSTTQQQKLEEELKQIKEERDIQEKEKNDLRKRLVDLQKEKDTEHQVAVNADLNSANLRQRNANLLRQVEELTVRNRELEATGAVVGTGGSSGSGNAPSITDPSNRAAPAGVRGRITGVSSNGSTLAQVNVGSDSGLSTGTVLTVYRGTEYKGELTLTTVEPKTAVGKFNPAKRTSKIEKDDNVITSFGGGQ